MLLVFRLPAPLPTLAPTALFAAAIPAHMPTSSKPEPHQAAADGMIWPCSGGWVACKQTSDDLMSKPKGIPFWSTAVGNAMAIPVQLQVLTSQGCAYASARLSRLPGSTCPVLMETYQSPTECMLPLLAMLVFLCFSQGAKGLIMRTSKLMYTNCPGPACRSYFSHLNSGSC